MSAFDLPADDSTPPPFLFEEQLRRMAEASHHAPDHSALYDAVAGVVAVALSADLVQVLEYIPAEETFVLRSGRGFPEALHDQAQVKGGLLSQAGRAMLDPLAQPVSLKDFREPHDWADDALAVEHGARGGIAVKVEGSSQDFGALCAFYRSPRTFASEEVAFMDCAARLFAAGIDRLEREEAATAWRSRAELLRAGAALTRVPAGRDELLQAAVLAAVGGGAGGSLPISDWCFADVLEPNGVRPKFKRVAFDHAAGAPAYIEEAFSVPVAATAPHGAPRVLATRRPELVDRIDEAFPSRIARDPVHQRALEAAQPYSYVCVPVAGRERSHGTERLYGALGFLRVETGTPVPYTKADRDACAEFAALLGVAIDSNLPSPDIDEAREAVRAHTGDSSSTPADAALESPTDTEQKVLERLAAGMTVEEVAEDLHLGKSTIKTHRRHIREKLGLKPKSTILKIVTESRRRGWLAA